MRLGTKFALLIAGTIAVPVATTILIGLVAFTIFPGPIKISDAIRIRRDLSALSGKTADPAQIPRLVRDASPYYDVLVYSDRHVLLSSTLHSDSLADILANGEGRQVLSFDRYAMHAPGGTPYSVYVGVRMISTQQAFLQRFMGVVFLLSLLGFMTLMSALIIRSINASIARLEEGTRRISAGDLDFELNAKGSDRIASLTRSFDAMRKRVREETATRSRFIMAVSHDLKTPLSSITGYLDAIGDGIASDPVQLEKYLAIIRDKAGLLGSRIGQLIDYVKLDTADWRRSREHIAIASFLDEAVTVFRLEAEARGFGFDSSIDIGGDTRVFMDGDLVTRALENLVHNAFRYGEPPSPIAFHAAEEDGRITIRIVNRGKAIPAADLPFIFEPFFRGTRAREGGGFGLGLSVVKSVVSSHGWSIRATSSERETCFTIEIPLDNKLS
ncbi:MAG: HAMP domain-containing sensor histidine kinase [Spirochaetia bacterium]|jgi:signal transduction histidine kinase